MLILERIYMPTDAISSAVNMKGQWVLEKKIYQNILDKRYTKKLSRQIFELGDCLNCGDDFKFSCF